MIRKTPIIRPEISFGDIVSVFNPCFERRPDREFISALSGMTGKQYVYPVNSGLAAFYLILMALREISPKKEVVLPAYTAGSLITVVRKAGLRPVLCDISLKDFNMDKDGLSSAVSENTLAVLAAHMFGMPIRDILEFKGMIPEKGFILEDCAQAMGARIGGRSVGSFSDAGFFSFNRGKNFTLFSGGCAFTGNNEINAGLRMMTPGLKKPGLGDEVILSCKIAISRIATDPFVYGLGYPLIACLKDNAPAADFAVSGLSALQSRLGISLLPDCQRHFTARHDNGIFIIEGLKGRPGIILPDIAASTYPVFNRLPILFKDSRELELSRKRLWRAGIESSRMYNLPLHHMFDLGYGKEDFPNAVYLAGHLLTLPVYPSLRRKDLANMIKAIIR